MSRSQSTPLAEQAEDFLSDQRRRTSVAKASPVFLLRGASAFLVIHGWCASPESVRFLTAGLADAGHSVLAPTLPGHGTTSADLVRFGPHDWFEATRASAEWLHARFDEVNVLGVSMGGALALQLAAICPQLVTRVMTVNAPVYFSSSVMAESILTADPSAPLKEWQAPAFHGAAVDEFTYDVRTNKSAADVMNMGALTRALLPAIRSPLCVLQSRLDPIVPPQCAEVIVQEAHAARAQLHWMHHSYHAAQLDTDRAFIIRTAAAFAREAVATV